MQQDELILVSHALCPYVQRAIILLEEKNARYTRKDIDLANKPDWFLEISPLGKTPVLLVNNNPIFESTVICEYLEETLAPPLHPNNLLAKAQQRSWMEFGAAVLNAIAGFYSVQDELQLKQKAEVLRNQFVRLEQAVEATPYFAGSQFSMVDAFFGPVFRYFDCFETFYDYDFFAGLPKLSSWRQTLNQRMSIKKAVSKEYPNLLRQFIINKQSALSIHALSNETSNNNPNRLPQMSLCPTGRRCSEA